MNIVRERIVHTELPGPRSHPIARRRGAEHSLNSAELMHKCGTLKSAKMSRVLIPVTGSIIEPCRVPARIFLVASRLASMDRGYSSRISAPPDATKMKISDRHDM